MLKKNVWECDWYWYSKID